MPPNKGGNSKKEAGRARKAENESKKQDVVTKQKEAKEAEQWKQGSKGTSKADLAAAKQAEAAAKKAEREALLAAEEASQPSKAKSAPKAGAKGKKSNDVFKSAGNAGAAAFRTDDPAGLRRDADREVTELSAVGIDQMLEAMEIANDKTDASTMGTKAAGIERHPERRFKAAFEAYLDRELPKLKDDHPGLRQNQMRDIIFKQFQKAPENPFNQASLAYNASKEERLDALKSNMAAREAKYRVDNE